MRVIIAGGTGLIGRALSEYLIKGKHEVLVLSRSPQKARDMPSGVQLAEWDSATAAGWGNHVNSADALINLAGAGIADAPWSDKRKELIRNSRIEAGQAVMDAIERASQLPSVLIQASAVGYYGSTQKDEVITEDSPAGSDFLAEVCQDWEASTAGVEAAGVRRAIIRTGIVLSNKGGAWPKIQLPFKLFAGGPLGSGQQWYPWIHIVDEIRAILFILENEAASGAFNLSAPEPVTNKHMAKAIGEEMNRPAFLPAPGFVLRGVLGDMSTIVLDGQRAIPKRLTDLGFTYTYPNVEAAIQELISS